MGNNDYSETEKLDIREGNVIIPWGFKAKPNMPANPWFNVHLLPGWVLPGGSRTTDREKVQKMISWIIDNNRRWYAKRLAEWES